MLSEESRKALIVWKTHALRTIRASFKAKKEKITMNVIQWYTPINDSEDDKYHFYKRLQFDIDKQSEKDLNILIVILNV